VAEQLGVRVDVEHPMRGEPVGRVMTHFPPGNARLAPKLWHGWTLVRRDVIDWHGPWSVHINEESTDAPA
jgi:hypothetical protein